MAKKNINKDVVKALTTKNYYSWILNGENSVDYVVSDSLSSLALDTGVPEVGSEIQDIKFTGGSDNAKVGTIANGFSYAGAADTVFLSQKSLTIDNVDAKTIFGGAVITSKAGKYTSPATKYTGTDVTVKGDANLYINNVKATSVYGGGAGYGSVLDGNVNITVGDTSKITNIYGGGQKGAVVEGDVNIVINRTGLGEAGKISNIYGGGDNATVLGDVNITINGVNSYKIGTVSGNGKGNKAKLGAETVRTLTIADYAGDFSATIKEFDKVVFGAGTAVTLTKAQQTSMKSAEYEFIVDWDSTKNPTEAMLTWNKKVNASALYVTIDADFANEVDTAFQKTIFTSNQITADFLDQMRVRDADGKDITSGYTLEFVAAEKNGKVQKKGGSIVLNYVGSKSELTAESGDTELTDAADKVSIKGDLVRASLDTKGGDDSVTVQTNTLMAGDIYLGEGVNTLNVQGDAEVTGSINVEKNSTNKINVNGTISQITGGDSTTNNIVTLRSDEAVGFYDYDIVGGGSGSISGSHDHVEGTGCSSCSSDTDVANAVVDASFNTGATYNKGQFHAQDLDFTSSEGSNDTVLVTTAAAYRGNINFGKGTDTLVLNADVHGTITADDGDDMIVANKTGINIDAATLKLSGTDNVFVANNGVYATINNAGAIGSFEAQYAGLYLSQNAMINVNGTLATMSYVGDIDLAALGGGSDLVILPVAQQLDRVSEYYVAGDGVKANINAAGHDITFRAGAAMDGTIYQDDTLVGAGRWNPGANYANTVRFMGTAGGAIYFNNDKATTTVQVDKGAVATVGSIDGLDGRTYDAQVNTFDADLAHVNFAGKNAAVYEKDGKNLIVGFTDKDIADFAETYGVAEIDQITVNGIMNGAVTFDNANVYTAAVSAFTPNGVGFNGDVNFVGANNVAVKTGGLVFDNEQMKFAEGATVDFTVLRDGVLVFDDIKAGEDYNHDIITVSFDQNARFAYGDTMKTKNWDNEFTADKLYTDTAADANPTMDVIRRKVEFVEGALLEGGIDLTGLAPGVEIKIDDNVLVKGKLVEEDAGAITLGNGADTLTIGKAEVNGKISANAGGADTIELTGSTVNAMRAPLDNEAIVLDNTDTLNVKEGALVNGDVTSGAVVHVMDSEVKGSINGLENVLINAKIGSIKGGVTYVESKSLEERATSEIGAVDISDAAVSLYADAADAKIGAIVSDVTPNDLSLMARNKGTVEIAAGIDATVGTANFTAAHKDSVMKFGGDLTLVAGAADVDGDGDVAIRAVDGGSVEGLGNVKVNGGWDPVTDSLELLTGTTKAANSVSIQSIVTNADDPALGSDLKMGNVELIADTSDITIGVQDSKNEFGDIFQSGAIAHDGKAATGTSPYGTSTIGQATSATIAVNQAASFTAGKIEQHAATSSVTFNGTAKADGIAQIANNNATVRVAGTADVGSIDQTAGNATVTFDGNDATLKGSIAQTADRLAVVNGLVAFNQAYGDDGKLVEKNDAIVADKAQSVITGDITQAAQGVNAFGGAVIVNANGDYNDPVNGDVNEDKHKDADVTFGSVEATYANVSQSGSTNVAIAGIALNADGESDVTVNGASKLTMGDLTQYSDTEDGLAGIDGLGIANVAAAGLVISGQNQGVLTLKGDVTGEIGAVKQTAFRANNYTIFGTARYDELEDVTARDAIEEGVGYGRIDDEGVNLALTVASIDMRAYAGNNRLYLAGNTEVRGDVSVGGVLAGEMLSDDSVWGDRLATENFVVIDVDTVKVDGDFSMIGLKNELRLQNRSFSLDEKGEAIELNAKSVSVVGSDNTVDIGYGVNITNVKLASLQDADGIGVEGYELGDGTYKNTFIVRGELGDGKVGYVSQNEKADDTLKVYGGIVKGNVDTKNGEDQIILGNDGADTVYGDSKIDGNVVMGVNGAAVGTNEISMTAFKTVDGDGNLTGAYNTAINGSVEMYAGGQDNAYNTLALTGDVFHDEAGYLHPATSTIAGGVTMDALSFDENGDVRQDSTNEITMRKLTKIGGDVTMTAFESNDLDVRATQEIDAAGTRIEGFADIAGKVTMNADVNSISVNDTHAGTTDDFISGAGAYMDGIEMTQLYKDGENYYLTGNNGRNTITVGNGAARDASELIVGKSVDELSDEGVYMGAMAFTKPVAGQANYVLKAVEIEKRGHDLITFADEQGEPVVSITQSNTIDVYGRFTAKDVTMLADTNEINLVGNGNLAKNKPDSDGTADITTDVRTATFKTADIIQEGVTKNEISAFGWSDVNKYETDEDGNKILVDELESVKFKSGSITQRQALSKEGVELDNSVSLTGSISAETGAIDQSGNGTNTVEVDGYLEQYKQGQSGRVAEVQYTPSTVASIKQESVKAYDDFVNSIDLDNTNVGGKIEQIAAQAGNSAQIDGEVKGVWYYDLDADGEHDGHHKTYQKSYAASVNGDLTQNGAFNAVALNEASVTGKIGQDATRGVDENDAAYTNKTNSIVATATTTAAAVQTTGDGVACPDGDGYTHDAESILVQAAFNTQSIGSIEQKFNNNVEGADAAANTVTLTNVNVGNVSQSGTGDVDNTFTQAAADSIAKMVEYTGEFDAGKAISKTATYDVLAKATVGTIDQEGTENKVNLTSVAAGAITQASKQFEGKSGLNEVNLANKAAVQLKTYSEMSLVDGKEVLTQKQIAESANDYAKTSTGDITQTSDAQRNYTKDGDYDATSAKNLVSNRGTTDATAATLYAADVGAIVQGLAEGAEAKFANVDNKVELGASTINVNEFVAEPGEKTFTETVFSTAASINQEGAKNEATITGKIGTADGENWVGGAVEQTANMLDSYDHNGIFNDAQKVKAAANTLAVYGGKDGKEVKTYQDENHKDVTYVYREETITKGLVGDVTQKVNDAGAKEDYLNDVVGNNKIDLGATGAAAKVGADFGNVIQKTTFGTNTMNAYGSAYSATTPATGVTWAGDKVVLDGKAIKQTGKANSVTLDNVKIVGEDDAATEDIVEGAITQTANAADVKPTESGDKKTTTYGKRIGNNAATISGESTIGAIKQTMNNVEFDKVTEEAGKDPTTEKLSTAGTNSIIASEGYRPTKLEEAEDPKSVTNPDRFTNGSFVGTIGDVTQTLTSYAKTVGVTADNSIDLTDFNAGAIVQEATGYAYNKVTANPITADTKQYKYDTDGFTAVRDNDAEAALKTSIASIKQTGFNNGVDLTDVTIGSITATGSSIADIKKSEAVGLAKLTVNDIDLNNVNAGTISATSELTSVELKVKKAGEKDPASAVVSVYGMSDIALNNSTVASVTTGMGNDAISLAGTTKVTGTIDMGGNTAKITDLGNEVYELDLNGGKDTLTISGGKVDLTGATIKNVEDFTVTINSDEANEEGFAVLQVKSLAADKITFSSDLAPYQTEIRVESLTIGVLDGVHRIAAVDNDTALSVTVNNDHYGLNVFGALDSDDDVLTFNEGNLSGSYTKDVEEVVFGNGATVGDGVRYFHTDNSAESTDAIAFTFEFAEGETEFKLGAFGTNEGALYGYANDKVTLNDFEYAGTIGGKDAWTASGTDTLAKNEKYYTYDGTTVTLQTNIA